MLDKAARDKDTSTVIDKRGEIRLINILCQSFGKRYESDVFLLGFYCPFTVYIYTKCLFVPFSGSVRVVRGEGMPQYRNPFEKGDLYIKFDVQFPDNNWISPEKLVV